MRTMLVYNRKKIIIFHLNPFKFCPWFILRENNYINRFFIISANYCAVYMSFFPLG